ncbi:Transcription elongation factor GreA [subsurface metagenome]
MREDKNYNIGEAASLYLASLSPEEKEVRQRAIMRFVQWYGREQLLSALTAPDVAGYAQQLSSTDTDVEQKLKPLKAFFGFAVKEGWIKSRLAVHLKARKKAKNKTGMVSAPVEVTKITRQGFEKIKEELATLKKKRPGVIAEISRAAADKDFRENAPLEAAREQCGHIDGRIRELEAAIKTAVIIEENSSNTLKTGIGDTLVLKELKTGEEMPYTIVGPREVDPIKGKISSVSPIGKALIGKNEGDTIVIEAPMGKTEYKIEKIQRK